MSRATAPHAALIVDDNQVCRDALAFFLEGVGFEVVGVSGSDSAMALLHDGFTPCAILLDVHMPQESGWRFVERLRADAALADIPVVLVSGARIDAERAARLGVRTLLPKPVDPEAFVDAVATECGRHD